MAEKLIGTMNTFVSRGGKRVEIVGGKPIPTNLPDGVVAALVQSGAAVTPEQWEAMNKEPGPELKPLQDDPRIAGDWKNTLTTDLQIREQAKEVYVKSGLATVRQILEYGEAHKNEGGLTHLDGIGEASEKETMEAIAKLAPKQ